MKKLMSIAMLSLMGLGLFGMAMQPMDVHAGGLFDDFDVNLNDGNLDVTSNTDAEGAWTTLLTKYKNFIIGIAGIAAISMVVLFIMQFLKLGASAGNPQARSQAITGILWTGIAAALLGSVALITGIFYNAI